MNKLIFLGLIAVLGFSIFTYIQEGQKVRVSQSNYSTVTIGNTRYTVEIADTDDKRAQGFSNRPSIPQDFGMLFLFDTKDHYAFWMKDTLIPLDFVWIADDTIVDITENVPIALSNTHLQRYYPKEPINKMLELNAGEVKRNSIQIGQKVSIQIK